MEEVEATSLEYPISIKKQSFGYSYHLKGYQTYTNSFLSFFSYLLQCMTIEQAQKTIVNKKGIFAELFIFGAHYILPLCQNNQQKCKEEMFGNQEPQKLDLETIMKRIMEKKNPKTYLVAHFRLIKKNMWPSFESILNKLVFTTKNQRVQKLTIFAKTNIIPIKIIPKLHHIEVFRNDEVDPTKQLITLQKYISGNVTSSQILSTIIQIADKLTLYEQKVKQPFPWITKQSIKINQNSNNVQLSIETILLYNVSGFFHYSLIDYLLNEKKTQQPYKPPKLSDRDDRITAEFIILLFYLESLGQINLSLNQLERVKLNSDIMGKASSFTITKILNKIFAKQTSLNLQQIAQKIRIKDIYQQLRVSNHDSFPEKKRQEKNVQNISPPPKMIIIKKAKQLQKKKEQNRDQDVKANNRDEEVKANKRDQEVKANNRDQEVKANNRDQEVKAKNRDEEVKAKNRGQEVNKQKNRDEEVKAKNRGQEVNRQKNRDQKIHQQNRDEQVKQMRNLEVKKKNIYKQKIWQDGSQQNSQIILESTEKYDAYKNIEYYWAQTLAKNEGYIFKDIKLKLAVYSIKFYMCLITYIFHFKAKPQNLNQKLKILNSFQEKVRKYAQQKRTIPAIEHILKINQSLYTTYGKEKRKYLIRCIYDILKFEFPPYDKNNQTTYFLYDKKVKFRDYKQNDLQVLLLAQVFMKAQENNKTFLEQVLLREYKFSKTKKITINENIIDFIRNQKYAFEVPDK